jgi:non-specific protein-tyrosine kinase
VSNLANVFSQAERRVILVDTDLRRPSLHHLFNLSRNDGLTNLVANGGELNGHGTQVAENLALIASGPVPPRPADFLGSARTTQTLRRLRDQADIVLLDSPPVLSVADASILSTLTDGVILVVDPSQTKRRELRQAKEAIEAVGGRILGVVINRLRRRGSGYYYYQSRTYQYSAERGPGRA